MNDSLTKDGTEVYRTITVHQPYASLLVTGEKLVENRPRVTRHRGLLLIHAGKSRKWLDTWHGRVSGGMPSGAIVGAVQIVDCLGAAAIMSGRHDDRYPWLRSHPHVSGPYCWVCQHAVKFERPIPCRGAQGIFYVARELVAAQLASQQLP